MIAALLALFGIVALHTLKVGHLFLLLSWKIYSGAYSEELDPAHIQPEDARVS
jgi:hypothetical protein